MDNLIDRMRLTVAERKEIRKGKPREVSIGEITAEAQLRKCLTVLSQYSEVDIRGVMKKADLELWPTCPVGGTSKP